MDHLKAIFYNFNTDSNLTLDEFYWHVLIVKPKVSNQLGMIAGTDLN